MFNTKRIKEDINIALDSLIVSQKDLNNNENDEEVKTLEDFAEKFIIEHNDHYNCHIKGIYFCNGKKFIGDDE